MTCDDCTGLCAHKRTYRRLFIGGPYSGQVREVQNGKGFVLPDPRLAPLVEDGRLNVPMLTYCPKDVGVFGARFRVYVLVGLEGAALEQELLRHCLSSVLLESRVG